ncbi:unnamed protein product [Dovyalis caffra]|uniref:Uncharacterized protein n=1 Tax=Dovyalis caffra TaxID=77055 RepID=A0AAV1QXV7_9ROSI|nr:unnamed protein product [Dovyalis caffra]
MAGWVLACMQRPCKHPRIQYVYFPLIDADRQLLARDRNRLCSWFMSTESSKLLILESFDPVEEEESCTTPQNHLDTFWRIVSRYLWRGREEISDKVPVPASNIE